MHKNCADRFLNTINSAAACRLLISAPENSGLPFWFRILGFLNFSFNKKIINYETNQFYQLRNLKRTYLKFLKYTF